MEKNRNRSRNTDAALLRKALMACGGNAAEVGRRVGVSRQLVGMWEKRGRVPTWRRAALQSVVDGRPVDTLTPKQIEAIVRDIEARVERARKAKAVRRTACA